MTTSKNAIEITEIIFPELANHHGTLFAGKGLQFMAKAAFLAARRITRCEVVMAGVSNVDFILPIPIGHVLTIRACVSRIGRSSLTVDVIGLAEAMGAPAQKALTGAFEMVAVDAQGRPSPIDTSYYLEKDSL